MRNLLVMAMAAFALPALPALAQDASQRTQRTEIGLLECDISGGIGYILGSSKDMTCVFTPSDGRPPQSFIGQVNRFGLDVGVTGQTAMKWFVLAPIGSEMPAAELEGDYAGVGVEATALVGLGANVMIGGSADSFALQPLSVQGQTGVNVAAGITEFELRAI